MTVVNSMKTLGGEVTGHISARLMAAYDIDDHTISVEVDRYTSDGRVQYHYLLERGHEVIFEGSDFCSGSGAEPDYGKAAREVLGFLTLRPGDTDDEFFADYTPEQEAWRDEFAEELSLYSLDPEEE